MSLLEAGQPLCSHPSGDVELLITAGAKDLGGFTVRRVLPAPQRMTVGPFIFFDEMGPAQFPPGEGMNVRPHPHIGLATVTYLFAGEIMHRDSLGFVQPIEPGAINLMTAGRGIVHSERTKPALLESGQFLHGIQTWMALPEGEQEIDPAFVHFPSDVLPRLEHAGVQSTVIIGSAFGLDSPVPMHSSTLYLEQRFRAGTSSVLPESIAERAVYVVDGTVRVGSTQISQGTLAVLCPGPATLEATAEAHVMVIGGAPIGERHVKWNFVHSSRERIDSAAKAWIDKKFDKIAGDEEFIPLPENFFEN